MYTEMTLEELHRSLSSRRPIVIELGCGPNPHPDIIGIDQLQLEGVDFVADLEKGLPFLPDNSVDEIRSRHFLEHIENFKYLMQEIYRVLKPEGRHLAVVPHFSNPHFYSDPTHKRFFGLYSFDYFAASRYQLQRKVPSFYADFQFEVIHRELVFNSQFFVRNLFKQVLRRLFNSSNYLQEWYEENLCYLFPCQEIRFVMVPQGKT